MAPLDLSSIYTITLFRTTTTLTVLSCGMHMQHPKVCMYMIRSALSLYLLGKESFIHKYMSNIGIHVSVRDIPHQSNTDWFSVHVK